jgi:diacylglycerol O-acyltransferase / wax synthase
VSDQVDAAGLPTELGAVDHLLHRGEANPRTRSGIMAVEILDKVPDWQRFRDTFENASRRVLRLRQKVVVPTLPTAAPRWVVDPDFNLDFHVRRMRIPEPGTLREVFDLAELSLQSPLDISRPLWTATLVEGLPDGQAAQLLHMSHAVTDGVGAVEMFANIFDLERDPPRKPPAPLPIPEDVSPNDLARAGLNRLPGAIVGGVLDALTGAVKTVGRVARNPRHAVADIVDYARSGSRVLTLAAEPSPLLRRRSLSTRSEAIDIDFPTLRAAAKSAEGSINDAYLAGLCGALRRYHEAFGMPIHALPMAVPVNLRAEDDPAGGNRFGGVMLAAPLDISDPSARIAEIHAQMVQAREERAINIVGAMAPFLSVMPSPVVESVVESIVSSDVQASNVPVYADDTYVAGAKVLRQYGLGPLPGVAMMAVLITRSGACTISTRYDRASFRDEGLWAECLLAGFEEVLALADMGDGHVRPASFTHSETRSVQSSPNGKVGS